MYIHRNGIFCASFGIFLNFKADGARFCRAELFPVSPFQISKSS